MCLWRSNWRSRFGYELPLRSPSTMLTKPQPRWPIDSCNIPSPLPPQDLCTCCSVYLHLITLLLLFSGSVVSDSLWPHGQQHPRPPCPSPSPTVCPNWCPLSRWCHPTISSPVAPFSSCLQSFPTLGSFPVSQFFASGDQRIGASASASVLPKNIQDWFPLGLTGLISLLPKELSRVFSSTTVRKHQFFSTQLSLLSNSHIHTWLLEKP